MKEKRTARYCAAELLHTVLEKQVEMEHALGAHEGFIALEERDRNFCRMLLATTLRRLGEVDAVLAQYVQRPLPESLFHVKHSLRLGVVQLVFMDVPAHAAVNDTVEVVAQSRWRGHKGLVNAVLKRVAREGKEALERLARPGLRLPPWLWESWQKAYGLEAATAIESALCGVPPLDVTVKRDAAMWAEALGGELLPGGSVRVQGGGRVESLKGFEQGEWWVQDVAAALPVRMLGALNGKMALDLCAAPGGKTAQLIAAGAAVTAVDRSAKRLERVNANLRRLGMQAEVIRADALKWKPDRHFDVIVLDAPCSATGTLRRHPDIAWHRTPADVEQLAGIQRRLLERASEWLKPGGTLLYCVCSLQPEEGEGQIAAFIDSNQQYSVLPPEKSDIGGYEMCVTREGGLRTLPSLWKEKGGMDGFYAAKLMLRA